MEFLRMLCFLLIYSLGFANPASAQSALNKQKSVGKVLAKILQTEENSPELQEVKDFGGYYSEKAKALTIIVRRNRKKPKLYLCDGERVKAATEEQTKILNEEAIKRRKEQNVVLAKIQAQPQPKTPQEQAVHDEGSTTLGKFREKHFKVENQNSDKGRKITAFALRYSSTLGSIVLTEFDSHSNEPTHYVLSGGDTFKTAAAAQVKILKEEGANAQLELPEKVE